MSWKQRNYYTGHRPGPPDGGEPPNLDRLPKQTRERIRAVVIVVALLVTGALMGLWLAPEGPKEMKAELEAARLSVANKSNMIKNLQQQLADADRAPGRGRLRATDRARHEREGRRYANALRRAGAQSAADLMEWFVTRWNLLLDYPQPDDRTGRRAATLSLLVGGMAANLNPGDYVPWQAEFFNADWLGELAFDLDGDGLPGPRSGPNLHDGFANVSICQVAMALNQAVSDARILIMPELRCDRVDTRMSVFLQGKTFDDAISEFVRAARDLGFIVVEKLEKKHRLVLVGARPPPSKDE